ncbi:MAG: hypothetical protein MUC60_10895 [Oscillatoria sp. Prado101]|nr:hypothetical protein [Oscillatoria sp. Prado101]
MGKRQFLLSVVHFLLKNITHTTYEGLEHIPAAGGVLIATNHLSRLDIPVLFGQVLTALCRPQVSR